MTRQQRRAAERERDKGKIRLAVSLQPQPGAIKTRPFHIPCGTSLHWDDKAEELVCPRCNVIITQDSEFELLLYGEQ